MIRPFAAVLLSGILLALAPGLAPYAAVAQVVVHPVAPIVVPVGAFAGAAASSAALPSRGIPLLTAAGPGLSAAALPALAPAPHAVLEVGTVGVQALPSAATRSAAPSAAPAFSRTAPSARGDVPAAVEGAGTPAPAAVFVAPAGRGPEESSLSLRGHRLVRLERRFAELRSAFESRRVVDEPPAGPAAPVARSGTPKTATAARAENEERVPLSPSLRQAADLIRSRPASSPGWLGVTLAMVALLLVPTYGETAFHEFGHYAAARMMGIRPNEVRLHVPLREGSDILGYVSHASTTPRKEIAVSLAGPLFSWLYFGGLLAAFVPVIAGALGVHFLLGYTALGVLTADVIFGLMGALGGGTSDLKAAFDAWRERPRSRSRRVRWTQANLDLIDKLKARHDASRPEILRKALTLLQLLSGLAQDGAIDLHAPDRSVKVILNDDPSRERKPGPPRSSDKPAQTAAAVENVVLTFDEPALRAIEAAKKWLGLGWSEQVVLRALTLLDIADYYTDENGRLRVISGNEETVVLMR